MLKIVKILSVERQEELRSYLDERRCFLERDISKYAVGRQRYWLQHEPKLTGGGKEYKPAYRLSRLWSFCSATYSHAITHCDLSYTPTAAVGLVAYGDVGISKHRDDTYADYPAVTINLSTTPTLWSYTLCYPEFKYSKQNENAEEEIHELPPGAVVLFNCKNPHAVVRCDKTRYSINLWSIAKKSQPHFNSYLESLDF